jgi:hypothetical protein
MPNMDASTLLNLIVLDDDRRARSEELNPQQRQRLTIFIDCAQSQAGEETLEENLGSLEDTE